jgi:hypothetical protein
VTLEELGSRIERVALGPDNIESQTLFRVTRAIYAITGWRARVRSVALEALVRTLGDAARTKDSAPARKALDAAVKELEANVDTVERATIMRKRASTPHAAWLRRSWELVSLAERAVVSLEEGKDDAELVRRVARADAATYVPPLALRGPSKPDEDASKENPFVAEVATRKAPEIDADGRLLELELAAIDHLLAAAREERRVLGRRRRLLVAARQRLLEAGAALPIDPAGARARASYIAREIARVDRLESAGLDADVGLVHQARLAIDRGDSRRLHAALAALDGSAVASGDAVVAKLTSSAVGKMWGGEDPMSVDARESSLLHSADELLGTDVVRELTSAITQARKQADAKIASGPVWEQQIAAEKLRLHTQEGSELELLRASVAVDGCFEVGGALSPVRVVEEERILRRVRHPTQDLLLVPAREVDDLPDAILMDPRTIFLDLAAGRLLARRYMREEVKKKTKTLMKSEVRVYVLDGSGSMKGPRARVRDAILIAELATLIARLNAPGATRCTLFYRYFDEELGRVSRIDGIASAKAAIRDVVATVREGGTNIEAALLSSLAQIESARELDPDLSRAQVVLVTDGEADVDEARIVAARDAIKGLPIGVSVIALGQENPALRALVAKQRAKGEPAFYHFLHDDELAAIARGELDVGLPIHLPDGPKRSPEVVARELEAEIGPIVDELASLERTRDVAALENLDAEKDARREAGIDAGTNADGERARIEALSRDRSSLEARFARWFPEPAARETPVGPKPGTPEHEDVDAVMCALASVAEVVALLGGSDLARRADAIDMLERLLPDARITPARYRDVLRDWPSAVAAPLAAIHASVKTTS